MKNVLAVVGLILLSGCATNSNTEKFSYIEKPKADCIKTAVLTAEAFSIIPFVAPAIAKSFLEKKGEEYKANTIQITKESGFFHVELEGNGYRCAMVTNK